jgi:AcrR family transcriptional regulator
VRRRRTTTSRTSAAAPYHHFKDKEALLAGVITHAFDTMSERMRIARGRSDDPWEQLEYLGRSYVGYAREEPVLFGLMFGAFKPDPVEHAALEAAGDCLFTILVEVCASVIATGETWQTDPRRLALTVWSGVHGLAVIDSDAIAEGARDKFGLCADDDRAETLESLLRTMTAGTRQAP